MVHYVVLGKTFQNKKKKKPSLIFTSEWTTQFPSVSLFPSFGDLNYGNISNDYFLSLYYYVINIIDTDFLLLIVFFETFIYL